MKWLPSMHEDYLTAGGRLTELPAEMVLSPSFYCRVPMPLPFWMTPGGLIAIVGLTIAAVAVIGAAIALAA